MILAILQGRLSSTRLPGKVLMPILDEPMIVRQLERIGRSREIDRVVVATSTDSTDDRLVAELEQRGIEVRRGPLADVAARFAGVIDEFRPDYVVRLTADCPLTDPAVIDAVIRSQVASGKDYTSNTIEPSFPDGLDVECFTREAFTRLMSLDLTAPEREHVTLGIYSRPEEFTLNSVTQPVDRSGLRWTVDVPDDLVFARAVYERLYHEDPEFDQQAIADLLIEHPELNRTDRDLARNSALGDE